jgi:hypothetical protein
VAAVTSELSLGRRIFFSLVLAGFVLVSVELACQLFYRFTAGDFLFRRTGAPIFEEDPHRCYRLKPNLDYVHRTNEFESVVYTNSQGMRTDARRLDVKPEKPVDVHRILFLGPSFTFGWGNAYEEAYPTVIGELLAAGGRRVEIVNMGTPAQGPEAQLCWLEHVGYRLRPDVVVQTIYGDRVPTVVGECPERLDCPVIEDSRLYTTAPTLRRKLIARAKNLGIVFYGYYAYQWALGARAEEAAGTGKELHGERVLELDPGDHDGLASDYARYESTVRRLLGEDVRVVFLFIPMSYVVHPGDASRWSHLLDADPVASRQRIRRAVGRLRSHGHLVIDPTEALVSRADAERLYYWLDIHLTPAGNRVVAEEAVSALRALMESEAP